MKTKKDYISPEDWKFMEQAPYGDPDFSEEHNRRVIAEVDEWNDRMDRVREKTHKESVRERSSAVSRYLHQLSQGRGVSGVDKYFGKRYLAYLRGQEILSKLKANPAVVERLKRKWSKKGSLQPL